MTRLNVRFRGAAATCLSVLSLSACGAPPAPTDTFSDATATEVAADTAISDAAPDGADAVDDAPPIEPAGPWRGSMALNFRASLEATIGNNVLTHALITDNIGRMDFSMGLGMAPAFAPQTVDWSSQGYRLVHLYATTADNLHVAFVYCQRDAVTNVYYESLTTLLDTRPDMRGAPCPVTMAATDIAVTLQPFERVSPDIVYLTGVTMRGTGLTLASDGHGEVTLGGIHWDVSAFGFVDCTTRCGTPGWWEVHSLLRTRGGATAFVIFYLMLNDAMHVRTSWGVRLDTPAAITNERFNATWAVE